MNKLKRKIVSCFVVIVFIIGVLNSIVDSVWDEIIAPELYPDGDYTGVFDLAVFSYIGISVVLDLVGAILFYVFVKKKIEEESKRQIQEQNMLYATIAHDLKTPMTSIQGFSKAFMEGKVKPEEEQEIYDIIYQKSKYMNDLVDTLFEYSKLGLDEYRLNVEEINLNVFVRDIVAENYCDFESHEMELSIDIPEEAIKISGDRRELHRAITNLIMNTYKHNPNGIKVLIQLFMDGNSIQLRIADSGVDIPFSDNVFDPFVTDNIARTAKGGTGLGLAITKKIIERHKGTISLEQEHLPYVKSFVIKWNR